MAKKKKNCVEAKDTVFEENNAKRIVTVDYERYAHYLDHLPLSYEEKLMALQTLQNIAIEFVRLGYGVHPLQDVPEACGKPETFPNLTTFLTANLVDCEETNLTRNFKEKSEPEMDSPNRGVA